MSKCKIFLWSASKLPLSWQTTLSCVELTPVMNQGHVYVNIVLHKHRSAYFYIGVSLYQQLSFRGVKDVMSEKPAISVHKQVIDALLVQSCDLSEGRLCLAYKCARNNVYGCLFY